MPYHIFLQSWNTRSAARFLSVISYFIQKGLTSLLAYSLFTFRMWLFKDLLLKSFPLISLTNSFFCAGTMVLLAWKPLGQPLFRTNFHAFSAYLVPFLTFLISTAGTVRFPAAFIHSRLPTTRTLREITSTPENGGKNALDAKNLLLKGTQKTRTNCHPSYAKPWPKVEEVRQKWVVITCIM